MVGMKCHKRVVISDSGVVLIYIHLYSIGSTEQKKIEERNLTT